MLLRLHGLFQSDQVPIGSIPRSMSVVVTGEATRHCAPGDTVNITGVLVPLMRFIFVRRQKGIFRTGFRQAGGPLVADVYLDAHFVENLRNDDENGYVKGLTATAYVDCRWVMSQLRKN